MTSLTPYLHLPGSAREALTFYASVFGGGASVHTLTDFGRTDGPGDAIAHGELTGGPVTIFAADAVAGQTAFQAAGLMFALLGTSDPATMQTWFARLSEGGHVIDDLHQRPWGATDGQVVDRFGLTWLIGFEDAGEA